jgi:hypothetical protein
MKNQTRHPHYLTRTPVSYELPLVSPKLLSDPLLPSDSSLEIVSDYSLFPKNLLLVEACLGIKATEPTVR